MDLPVWADHPIVDSHLDLAENVTLFGRDMTLGAVELRQREKRSAGQATATLPELRRGNVAVAFATVTPGFLVEDAGADFQPQSALYRTAEQAETQALRQVAIYEDWQRRGLVRIIQSNGDLEHHLELWRQDRAPGLVMLMEGADPIVQVADLPKWRERGLRIIGLTYGNTRYGVGVAGGRPVDGGLTADGVALLQEMAAQGFIWDISHLAEQGVRQGLEAGFPRVCASHANTRLLTPTTRHLSDEVIGAIAGRGGVIGLVLYNRFLEPRWKDDKSIRVSLDEHLRRHAEHMAGVGGWEVVGIGSDLDGGFGLEESPAEIDTEADLYKIGYVVPVAARAGVLGGNWLRFLRWALPKD